MRIFRTKLLAPALIVLLALSGHSVGAADQSAEGAYKASATGEAVSFEAETNSARYGKLLWKGTIRGNEIEGTFVHYRKGWMLNPNPEPVEHWFKGQAKG